MNKLENFCKRCRQMQSCEAFRKFKTEGEKPAVPDSPGYWWRKYGNNWIPIYVTIYKHDYHNSEYLGFSQGYEGEIPIFPEVQDDKKWGGRCQEPKEI